MRAVHSDTEGLLRRSYSDRPTYEPTDEDVYARRVIDERYNPDQSVHLLLEKTWLYNLAFLMGHQYHTWSDTQWGLVYRPRRSRFRIREMRNFIRSYVERKIATITGMVPEWRVRPNSSDIEDSQAAQVGEKILRHYWRHANLDMLFQDACYWLATTGNGFFKVFWDPSLGKQWVDDEVDEMGLPMLETNPANGEPRMRQRLYSEGDVRIEVVPPFSIYCDPFQARMEDQEWIIERDRRPIQWVERFAPDKAMYIVPDGGREDERTNWRQVLNVISPGGNTLGGVQMDETERDWVTVTQYWERPSISFPKGRLIICAGQVVIFNGDNPTPNGDLPYVHFTDLPVPGRFWAQAHLENLVAPQRNYNRIVSNYIEHILLTAHAKVLVPNGMQIPDGQFNDEIGEFLTYNPPNPPSYLQPPNMPAESDTEMNRIRADFDQITNTFGPERGQYTGKLSGRAIDLLVEQGSKAKEPIIRRMGAGLEKLGRLVLATFQEHAQEERTIKITGRRNSFDIYQFSGSDVSGNTDVLIDVQSMMPKSRTMALQELQILASAGLLNMQNPSDRAKGWAMLQQEDDSDILELENMHRRRQRLENRLMAAGHYIAPAWTENHDIHMEELLAYMNSDEFQMLPPQVQQLFHEHARETGMLATPQPGVTLQGSDRAALGAPPPAPAPEPTSAEE